MSDIFISYSSRDREKADQLTEMLSSAGLSVWIDQHGIDVATSWSEEIVDAIDGCKVFIIMLSSSSIASHNVVKEVSLASEKRKKIVPLDIEPVEIPKSLQYALAGIQRCAMTNIDRLIRMLGKFGLEATSAPSITLVKETDSRKSLMILPFEDLSPTADNEWFANGIVSELIGALSNIKALRIADHQATKEFKNYHGQLSAYAQAMRIRYFVQGDVRKFGDQIKIASRLLDVETGDYLWQDSMKGTMNDIFDIQEAVARHVVIGLRIILTEEEEEKIEQKPTEDAEAYELYLKAKEYYDRHNRADIERAIGIYEEAARIDPAFADAHLQLANAALAYYRAYSRDAETIAKVEAHIAQAAALLGESAKVYWIRGILARTIGKPEEALRYIERAIAIDPEFPAAYDALAITSALLGKKEDAAHARERQVELQSNDRNARFSYLHALNRLGDEERLREAARNALPVYERHLRLAPDDAYARVQYAGVICMAGERERGLAEARKLEAGANLDSYSLFHLACAYLHGGEKQHGIEVLRKAVMDGYRNVDLFRIHPDLDRIRNTPEFAVVMQELEEKIAKEKNGG